MSRCLPADAAQQGPSRGQPQVINTKTLVIYGTGRTGGVPQLFAVDKATGKELATAAIPSPTTAVPMTFLHNGRQYIVVVVGAGGATLASGAPATNPPKLVALALPR
jgi:quinoprotein glucose dehydrogenase